MTKHQSAREGYNVQLIDMIYHKIPRFTDVFDEESFYNFVILFVLGTILLAFLMSRFVTIKPVEW